MLNARNVDRWRPSSGKLFTILLCFNYSSESDALSLCCPASRHARDSNAHSCRLAADMRRLGGRPPEALCNGPKDDPTKGDGDRIAGCRSPGTIACPCSGCHAAFPQPNENDYPPDNRRESATRSAVSSGPTDPGIVFDQRHFGRLLRAGPHSDRCPRIVEATLFAQLESLHKSSYRVNLDTNWRGFNDVLHTEARRN